MIERPLPEMRPTHSSEPRLGVALVGVGRWGQHWLGTLSRSQEVDLLWVCDLVARRDLAAPFRWTRDYRDCLNDPRVDAAVLATPLDTHARLGLDVLRAGRHVLLEKPAATRLGELAGLLDAARDSARVVMANHLLLFHPAFARLEREVTSGTIGELRGITAIRISEGNRPHESPWWTLAPHDLALVDRLAPQLLKGAPALEQRGHEQRATLRHGDVEARLVLSLCGRRKVRLFAVHGTRGSLVFDDLAQHQLTLHDGPPRARLDEHLDDRPLSAVLGSGRPLSFAAGAPLERALSAFCATIATGARTTAADPGHLERVVHSLERGAPLTVAAPPQSFEVLV